MPRNYILADIKEILESLGYTNIYTNQVTNQTSQESALYDSIYLIEQNSSTDFSNISNLEFDLYLRRQDPEVAENVARAIYHSLHGRRENIDTVANGYSKINLIQAISRPRVYSTLASGANVVEYIIKFRVQWIDGDFDNL